MAANKKLKELKTKVDELRSVVSNGFEKLVDHELILYVRKAKS